MDASINLFVNIFCNIAMSQDAIPVRVYVQAYGTCQTIGEGGTVTVRDYYSGDKIFMGPTNGSGYYQGSVAPNTRVNVYVTYNGHFGEQCDITITQPTTLYVCCEDVNCFAK